MLVGFEKAFDTVEWPFIEKNPFGPTFRKVELSQVDSKADELLNKVMLIGHK
jgi:hypothetical protein